MVIYEVNLDVEQQIASEFRNWLDKHVVDMLELPGFASANIYECESDNDVLKLVVHYHLESRALLEDYFIQHAAKMRADGEQRFGSQFKASRRILSPIK